MSPTQRQLDALRFIRGYQLAKGHSPCLREIAVGTGCAATSKATVRYSLRHLERAGLLRKLRQRERAIEVLTDIPVPRDPDGFPLYFVRLP